MTKVLAPAALLLKTGLRAASNPVPAGATIVAAANLGIPVRPAAAAVPVHRVAVAAAAARVAAARVQGAAVAVATKLTLDNTRLSDKS